MTDDEMDDEAMRAELRETTAAFEDALDAVLGDSTLLYAHAALLRVVRALERETARHCSDQQAAALGAAARHLGANVEEPDSPAARRWLALHLGEPKGAEPPPALGADPEPACVVCAFGADGERGAVSVLAMVATGGIEPVITTLCTEHTAITMTVAKRLRAAGAC